ncbi:hypothetical protein Aduo_000216 [Ancylostoma duodenale]
MNFIDVHIKLVPQKRKELKASSEKLYWDCNIEYNAYLLNCNGNAPLPAGYAQISAPMNLGRKCKDPKDETLSILKNWWDEVKLKDLSTDPTVDPNKQKNFGVMATGVTNGFACTYNKQCSNNLLCLYNKVTTAPLYTKVAGAGQECNTCADCVDFLCPTPDYTPAKDTYPLSLCTNTGQSDDGMTNEMQVTAEDMVNYYRRLVGSGWAPDKNGYALPGKKMLAVKYDCDTGAVGTATKTIAAKCTAPYTATPGYYLSYYQERDLTKTRVEVLREAIKKWADQSKLVDLGETVTFTGDVETNAPDFANMVNEAASKVVCSVTEDECLKQGYRVAVCQYDTSLNDGDTVYTTGKACSKCPAGTKCDNDLGGGLCV